MIKETGRRCYAELHCYQWLVRFSPKLFRIDWTIDQTTDWKISREIQKRKVMGKTFMFETNNYRFPYEEEKPGINASELQKSIWLD